MYLKKNKGMLEPFPSHRNKKKQKNSKILTPRPIPSLRGCVPKKKE